MEFTPTHIFPTLRINTSNTIVFVERINQLINPIHMQIRSVLPAADFITVSLQCYPCYSYGIILLPRE
jgi:hypothetical protein